MSPADQFNPKPANENFIMRKGWDAALLELQHQASHLEARGAHRAAVTLYDAIRIARSGGLECGEHQPTGILSS